MENFVQKKKSSFAESEKDSIPSDSFIASSFVANRNATIDGLLSVFVASFIKKHNTTNFWESYMSVMILLLTFRFSDAIFIIPLADY